MQPQRLPDSIDPLVAVSLSVISKLTWQGEKEGATNIRQALEPALIRHREYQALKSEPGNVLLPALHRADAAITKFIGASRAAFRPHFGLRWSPAWASVGFVNGTLAVPTSYSGRENLLNHLRSFLASHPELECQERDVTAAKATQLLDSLHAARTALRGHTTRQSAAKAARRKTCVLLRKRLRTTIAHAGV